MDVTGYFAVARRRWRIILVCALFGVIAGAGYTIVQEDSYSSSSQLYVSVQDRPGTADTLQSLQSAQQRLVSYASLATGQAVTQAVVDQLKLDTTAGDVARRITVAYPPGTVLLDITTTAPTAGGAQELNAAVGEQLQDLVRRLETPAGGGNPLATLAVVDPPSDGTGMRASPRLYVPLGLIVGLGAGMLIAFIRDRSNRRVFRADRLAGALGVPVIGPIESADPGDTEIRRLRTSVLSAHAAHGATTVLVCGAGAQSAPVAGALASALGSAGRRTILVDGVFGDRQTPGLGEALAGTAEVTGLLADTGGSGVRTLGPGDLDENALGLIASPRFDELLTTLEEAADFVVVHLGELAATPEIISAAHHPVVAVIVIRLGLFDAHELVTQTAGLVDAAQATIGLAVGHGAQTPAMTVDGGVR